MRARTALLIAAVVSLSPLPLRAQHGGPPPDTKAPREASQYDFLLGQWDVVVKPKVGGLVSLIHGAPTLHGSWKGWRALDGWGIEDELRIADESGNPVGYSHATRVYAAAAKHWSIAVIDVYRQRLTTSSAEWLNGQMSATSEAIDPSGKPYRSRTRFSDITPNGFRYQQDVSYDGGATWDEARLVMTAKRLADGAAR
jgi:hypothetical protein